ncbi:MAG: DUF3048 domain-containing protein, partial [Actinomycetes bacterium]
MSPRGWVLPALAVALLLCVLPAVLLAGARSAPEIPPPVTAAPVSPSPAEPLPSPTPSPIPSLPPSPIPSPPPVSPFTGMPTDLGAPVLSVKIDNAKAARPQTGLALADLVYVEPVEGGISRLLAVYQSHFPPLVGPVRSTRLTDLQLLANFGRPALAFSGAAAQITALVARAPVLDVSEEKQPRSYRRDRRKRMPHNLYGDTFLLRRGGQPPRDIGFRFGPTPPGGRSVPGTNVRYRATDIGVQWVPTEARWVISMDGAPFIAAAGPRPGAATVVLQRV